VLQRMDRGASAAPPTTPSSPSAMPKSHTRQRQLCFMTDSLFLLSILQTLGNNQPSQRAPAKRRIATGVSPWTHAAPKTSQAPAGWRYDPSKKGRPAPEMLISCRHPAGAFPYLSLFSTGSRPWLLMCHPLRGLWH
jgi:hypothetical protein